jgi:adenylosuccinate lyase
MMMFS